MTLVCVAPDGSLEVWFHCGTNKHGEFWICDTGAKQKEVMLSHEYIEQFITSLHLSAIDVFPGREVLGEL